MNPKVLAAVTAAVVGSVCASLFGLGLARRPMLPPLENDTAAPGLAAKPATEPAKRIVFIDDEFAAQALVGGFVTAGNLVDVLRVVSLANGDTQSEIVLKRVRVRERGEAVPGAVRFTFEVTPEQASQLEEAKKKPGKLGVMMCPIFE